MLSLSHWLAGVFSAWLCAVEMDICGLPPFRDEAAKGWGTRSAPRIYRRIFAQRLGRNATKDLEVHVVDAFLAAFAKAKNPARPRLNSKPSIHINSPKAPSLEHIISTEGGAFAAAAERHLYFVVALAVAYLTIQLHPRQAVLDNFKREAVPRNTQQ